MLILNRVPQPYKSHMHVLYTYIERERDRERKTYTCVYMHMGLCNLCTYNFVVIHSFVSSFVYLLISLLT